jgi:hypothetical protein
MGGGQMLRPERVTVISVTAGSVVVRFMIADNADSSASTAMSAGMVFAELQQQLMRGRQANVPLMQGDVTHALDTARTQVEMTMHARRHDSELRKQSSPGEYDGKETGKQRFAETVHTATTVPKAVSKHRKSVKIDESINSITTFDELDQSKEKTEELRMERRGGAKGELTLVEKMGATGGLLEQMSRDQRVAQAADDAPVRLDGVSSSGSLFKLNGSTGGAKAFKDAALAQVKRAPIVIEEGVAGASHMAVGVLSVLTLSAPVSTLTKSNAGAFPGDTASQVRRLSGTWEKLRIEEGDRGVRKAPERKPSWRQEMEVDRRAPLRVHTALGGEETGGEESEVGDPLGTCTSIDSTTSVKNAMNSVDRQITRRPSWQGHAPESKKVHFPYKEIGLCGMDKHHHVRRVCIWLIRHKLFDALVIGAILVNSVFFAMIDYSCFDPDTGDLLTDSKHGPGCWRNRMIEAAEPVFLWFFTLELVVKVMGMGFSGKGAYLSDYWNWLDLLVVVFGLVELAGVDAASVSTLRIVRGLRPLRTLNRAPRLRELVISLIASIPPLFNVVLLLCFIISIWGILGVQLWGWTGAAHGRCRITPFPVAMPRPRLQLQMFEELNVPLPTVETLKTQLLDPKLYNPWALPHARNLSLADAENEMDGFITKLETQCKGVSVGEDASGYDSSVNCTRAWWMKQSVEYVHEGVLFDTLVAGTGIPSIILSYTPLIHPSHTPLSYTPLIHPSHTPLSYTPLIHPSHTLVQVYRPSL